MRGFAGNLGAYYYRLQSAFARPLFGAGDEDAADAAAAELAGYDQSSDFGAWVALQVVRYADVDPAGDFLVQAGYETM